MISLRKSVHWLILLAGVILGYIYAYLALSGALESWHFIGQPAEVISQVIGFRTPDQFLVATASGQYYSFEYPYDDNRGQPPGIIWTSETDQSVDQVQPIQYFRGKFITLPPPFQALQYFEMSYLYHVEGIGKIILALSPQGDLWIWDHKISGLTGLILYFYPGFGFFLGFLAILIYSGFIKLREKARPRA